MLMRMNHVCAAVLIFSTVVFTSPSLASAQVDTADDDDDIARARTHPDALAANAAFFRALSRLARAGDVGKTTGFVDDIATLAVEPLVRARGQFESMRMAFRRGDVEKSVELTRELGFVSAARVIGPDDNAGGVMFKTALAGETSEDFADATVITAEPRQARMMMLAHFLEETQVKFALGFVVESSREQDVAIRIGSSGQAAVVVNGVDVGHFDGDRPLGFDQTAVGARLRKGDNLVVIRLGALSHDMQARVRLTKPDGRPLSDVTTSIDAARMRAVLSSTTTSPTTSTTAKTTPRLDERAKVKLEASSSVIPVARVDAETDAFIAGGPLVRVPTEGDTLWDAVVVEMSLRARDAREAPMAHEVWLFALKTRLRLHPPNDGNHKELARTLLTIADVVGKTDASRARASIDEVLALDSKNVAALLRKAALREDQGFLRDARGYHRRALAEGPLQDRDEAVALRFLRTFSEERATVDREIIENARRFQTEARVRLAIDVLNERNDVATAAPFVKLLATHDEVDRTASRWFLDGLIPDLASDDVNVNARALAQTIAHLTLLGRHFPAVHSEFRRLALVHHANGEKDVVEKMLAERQRAFPFRPEPWSTASEVQAISQNRKGARALLIEALSRGPQDSDLARTFSLLDDGENELWRSYAVDAAFGDDVVPVDADVVGAYVVANVITARVFENGLGTIVEDRVVRIVDAKKADRHRVTRVGWSEGRERVQVLHAERRTRDGVVEEADFVSDEAPTGRVDGVYTDARTRVIGFRAIEDGDTLHVRVRTDLVGRQNLFGDFFGRVESMQSDLPTKFWRFVVESPREKSLSWGGRHAPTPEEELTEAGTRRLVFTRTDVPRIRFEDGMPPFLEQADFVSVSTYERWEDLGRWYIGLIKDTLPLDDDVKAVAHAIARDAEDEEGLVRRMYEHVVTHTRYVGIELGIHGWKPYPASHVHRRRYGDCKDKATLLVAMLHEVGIDARIALTRTSDLGDIPPTPASMWLFNHAIAYVPSLDLFLDGTAESSGFRELPGMDEGGMALLVDPFHDAPASLIPIPVSPPESNLNSSSYVLEINPAGHLGIHVGDEQFRGQLAARERVTLADEGTRKERLERMLGDVLPGIAVHELDVTDLSLSTTTVGYRFSAVVPERAQRQPDGRLVMPISLYPHDLIASYGQRAERTQPLRLRALTTTKNVMRYIIPRGYALVDLPSSTHIERANFRFVQTVTPTDDGFVVEEETTLRARTVSVEDYPAFRDDLAAADRAMRATVTLSPTNGGDS